MILLVLFSVQGNAVAPVNPLFQHARVMAEMKRKWDVLPIANIRKIWEKIADQYEKLEKEAKEEVSEINKEYMFYLANTYDDGWEREKKYILEFMPKIDDKLMYFSEKKKALIREHSVDLENIEIKIQEYLERLKGAYDGIQENIQDFTVQWFKEYSIPNNQERINKINDMIEELRQSKVIQNYQKILRLKTLFSKTIFSNIGEINELLNKTKKFENIEEINFLLNIKTNSEISLEYYLNDQNKDEYIKKAFNTQDLGLWEEILAQEKKYVDDFQAFYHGTSLQNVILYEFINLFLSTLNLRIGSYLRSESFKEEAYKNVQTFLQKFYYGSPLKASFDHRPDVRNALFPVSYSLFNEQNGESALYAYKKGIYDVPNMKEILFNFLNLFHIDPQLFDSIYDDFSKIWAAAPHRAERMALIQVFINNEVLDDLVYWSKAYGVPMSNAIPFSAILEKWKVHQLEEETKSFEAPQARILVRSPLFFDTDHVKIFMHYAPEEKGLMAGIRNRLVPLVDLAVSNVLSENHELAKLKKIHDQDPVLAVRQGRFEDAFAILSTYHPEQVRNILQSANLEQHILNDWLGRALQSNNSDFVAQLLDAGAGMERIPLPIPRTPSEGE